MPQKATTEEVMMKCRGVELFALPVASDSLDGVVQALRVECARYAEAQ